MTNEQEKEDRIPNNNNNNHSNNQSSIPETQSEVT